MEERGDGRSGFSEPGGVAIMEADGAETPERRGESAWLWVPFLLLKGNQLPRGGGPWRAAPRPPLSGTWLGSLGEGGGLGAGDALSTGGAVHSGAGKATPKCWQLRREQSLNRCFSRVLSTKTSVSLRM